MNFQQTSSNLFHLRADSAVREAVAGRLLAFWQFFRERAGAARGALTVRDLLAWAGFVAAAAPAVGALAAYAHGAHLALLDGVGLGLGVPQEVGPGRGLPRPCALPWVSAGNALSGGAGQVLHTAYITLVNCFMQASSGSGLRSICSCIRHGVHG